MARRQTADPAPGESAPAPRKRKFEPTAAQRAFVAAASGFGVPPRIICQMLPGARPGQTLRIKSRTLKRRFARELREGLTLANALVKARVFQRALSLDDRSAVTAQTLILNAQGAWMPAAGGQGQEPGRTPLAIERLSPSERVTLRRLVDKATPEAAPPAATDAPRRRRFDGGTSST